MINISINVKKILKEQMKTVQSGVYLDLFLFENRDGKDRFGNDGIVFQSVSKEAREAKIQGPILGNFKYVAKATKPAAEAAPKPANRPVGDEFDDVPF